MPSSVSFLVCFAVFLSVTGHFHHTKRIHEDADKHSKQTPHHKVHRVNKRFGDFGNFGDFGDSGETNTEISDFPNAFGSDTSNWHQTQLENARKLHENAMKDFDFGDDTGSLGDNVWGDTDDTGDIDWGDGTSSSKSWSKTSTATNDGTGWVWTETSGVDDGSGWLYETTTGTGGNWGVESDGWFIDDDGEWVEVIKNKTQPTGKPKPKPIMTTTVRPRPGVTTPKPVKPGTGFAACDGSSHGKRSSLKKRIVGGTETKYGDYPFLIAMVQHRPGVYTTQFCGGTIVNEWFIISAAHCVYDPLGQKSASQQDKKRFLKNLYIIVGEHHLKEDSQSEELHKVISITLHRGYKPEGYTGHDMLLLKLKTPIKFAKYVRPVCMPNGKDKYRDGDRCYVAGWGVMENRESPVLPREASGQILSEQKCRNTLGFDTDYVKTFCTLGEKGNACNGDSGGPVICYDKKDQRWELAGLVSYGVKGCSNKGLVAQRVSYFLPWLKKIVGQ